MESTTKFNNPNIINSLVTIHVGSLDNYHSKVPLGQNWLPYKKIFLNPKKLGIHVGSLDNYHSKVPLGQNWLPYNFIFLKP
jgi:hypothetical protein